ncbi:MAG TPA: restriction endonuclease subunit S [Syntrophobacteraceae bacterium]|nr:restriction endonuclease subunit S [Syntrophobacteraceae bacterium]
MRWPVFPLDKIADVFGGSTPRRNRSEYWDGDIPWVTPTDLPMPGTEIADVYDTADHITPEGLRSCAANLLPVGTVLYSSRATIGKIGIARVPLATNQGFANFAPKPGVESKYLAYALQYFTVEISSLAGSTTFKEVRRGALKKYKVPLPSPSEQHRIVEILDQADALRKKRAEADAKAARILPALFYKMFGDPLALVTSGQGVPLSELEVDLQNGFACGEKDVEDGVPHLRMNNIDDAGVLNLELVRTVPVDRDTERYRLKEKDVLFMGTNSEDKIGKTCLFMPPDERAYLFSNHLIRLRVSDSRITPEYLAGFLHLLWSKRFFPSIAKRWVNQSTVAQPSLAALRIPLPGERSLHMFTTAFQNLLSMRAQRVRSGETLDQTFAVLLHRAFTGDLTAKWREAHMKELLQEMEQQAKELEIKEP